MMGSTSASVLADDGVAARALSATSWGAIFAGAAAAVGLTTILLMLGAGLGLSALGASATTLSVAGIIWLIVTQWLSAAAGGYLTGRLRVRWLSTHRHEVFFRDTAHGLVTWAVATLFMAALVGGAAGGAAGGVMHASAPMLHGPMHTMASPGNPEVDRLLRSTAGSGTDAREEVAHVMAALAAGGGLSDEDRSYLAAVVASKAGISSEEAHRRVDAAVARTEAARKSAAEAAILTALSLVIGAFIASVSAALGGHLRDEHM